MARVFGCVRVMFNDALAAREFARWNGAPIPTHVELSAALTVAKTTPERAWLAEVSSVPLQQALVDFDRAHRNFLTLLAGQRKGPRMGAPRYKSKRSRQSARFTANARFRVAETTCGVGHVVLPKVGRVRFALPRLLPVTPSSVTVIREADGRYYVSFVVDEPAQPPLPSSERVSGVDLGLIDLAVVTSSDGTREKVANPRWLRTFERALVRAQRSMERKQKGSRNWDKARQKFAALHRKVRETRLDHHRKLARRIVRENQAIALEGLHVHRLARSRLAKSVHDVGWATLTRLIKEMSATHGRDVIIISPWEPTSRVCSVCGINNGPKPLYVRTWTCECCGATLDRDYNAAVNIMVAAGLAETLNACGPDVRLRLAGAVRDEAGTHRTDCHRVAA
ncbi:transposase [Kocuria rosea]|nr:transposase [Kocuria rosea]